MGNLQSSALRSGGPLCREQWSPDVLVVRHLCDTGPGHHAGLYRENMEECTRGMLDTSVISEVASNGYRNISYVWGKCHGMCCDPEPSCWGEQK